MTAIESCHQCYCQMTHMEIRLPIWERAFSDFLEHGFTVEDLQMVLGYLMRENRRMNGAKFSLRLNTLLDFEYRRFDSFLSEAKAIQRNKRVTKPADKALDEWRGLPTKTGTDNTARTAGDVLRSAVKDL
jgi:hypothetical protein